MKTTGGHKAEFGHRIHRLAMRFMRSKRVRSECGRAWSLGCVAALLMVTGACSSTYKAVRTLGPDGKDHPEKRYILREERPYSLGFIEFDEQGEAAAPDIATDVLLDLDKQAKVAQREGKHLLVFVYVHGWENNAQSADVDKFDRFLASAANRREVREHNLSIYGVYIAWHGRGVMEMPRNPIGRVLDDTLMAVPKVLSFWTREAAAARVARVSGTEALLWIAKVAKGHDPRGNKVVVIGHSFGARVVEEALNQACQARMLDPKAAGQIVNPPADLVVLLNEATDALQSKRMQEVFDRAGRYRGATVSGERPLFVSVTSSADTATGFAFPIGRWLESIASVDRPYTDGPPKVTQHTYLRNTAGHIDSMMTHQIVADNNPTEGATDNFWRFQSDPDGDAQQRTWKVQRTGTKFSESPYWVVRCGHDFIGNHGDVWNGNVKGLIFALLARNETLDPSVQTTLKASEVSELR